MNIQPFNIAIPQSTLDDLRERLARTRWPDEVEGAGWSYGTNLDYLKRLVTYWQHEYDWRKQEAALNRYSQFRADIDGLGIHFIHERGKGPNPLPIILTHGWPDSFYRMHKIIPMLTDPERFGGNAADSFDVIVPSIPGFGFSDPVRKPGWTVKQTAEVWGRLMRDVLGYQHYAAAGGDGGSPISQLLALNNPTSVIGIHLTDIGFQATMNLDPSSLTPIEQGYLGAMQQRFFQEGGYVMIQSTKPQTLAYGLSDSPVGLAAWIIEKFYGWSDIDGDLERTYTKDELLTNIMIYWVTQTINPSIRSYYEESHMPSLQAGLRIEVPVAMALFPKDTPAPRALAERTLRIERWTEMPRGGHFPALEEPELLAEDLRAFYRSMR
ncbi:epoxide hydrolase family protein [Ktedonospora formicarum]|uniref:Multidrug MFS transporter n=1 Tax=Ktedonospora formicarum TaxID=2778364 RepID=A0A8J3MRD3_9CHLR|nr:epoxide hydrolase family protein [Ktedonospora formicarum]GHO42155.1 multidrug MFS transporter [Ktedonospora formicarum]